MDHDALSFQRGGKSNTGFPWVCSTCRSSQNPGRHAAVSAGFSQHLNDQCAWRGLRSERPQDLLTLPVSHGRCGSLHTLPTSPSQQPCKTGINIPTGQTGKTKAQSEVTWSSQWQAHVELGPHHVAVIWILCSQFPAPEASPGSSGGDELAPA